MKIARYRIHHAANIFPLMSDAELARLAADIQLHGLQEPIVLLHGVLLDGRNRLRACEKLGIAPTFRELGNCEDPQGFVRSANLHRRQLTKNQRMMSAACVTTLARGSNQYRARKVDSSPELSTTIDQASKDFSVSPASIKRARQIIDRGAQEIVDAVKHGDISVSLAAKFVAKVTNKNEQRRIAKLGVDEIRKVVQQREDRSVIQHLKKLVKVMRNIRENWPREYLSTLTAKLTALTEELKADLQRSAS